MQSQQAVMFGRCSWVHLTNGLMVIKRRTPNRQREENELTPLVSTSKSTGPSRKQPCSVQGLLFQKLLLIILITPSILRYRDLCICAAMGRWSDTLVLFGLPHGFRLSVAFLFLCLLNHFGVYGIVGYERTQSKRD